MFCEGVGKKEERCPRACSQLTAARTGSQGRAQGRQKSSPRLRWPWCKAPIVGTNPTNSRRSINSARHSRSAATEVRIGNGAGGSEAMVQGRFARSRAAMREKERLAEKWSDEKRKFFPTSARRIRLAGLPISLLYTLHLKIAC